MTHLVSMYDAIKKLNKLLLGKWKIHGRDGGVLEELDRVCDVIEGGICAELRLRRKDEMYECLADILDDAGKAPEERARMLIGLDNVFDVIYHNSHMVYLGDPDEGQELFFQILMSRNLTSEQRADILINGMVQM